jgi:hypothetical protein
MTRLPDRVAAYDQADYPVNEDRLSKIMSIVIIAIAISIRSEGYGSDQPSCYYYSVPLRKRVMVGGTYTTTTRSCSSRTILAAARGGSAIHPHCPYSYLVHTPITSCSSFELLSRVAVAVLTPMDEWMN